MLCMRPLLFFAALGILATACDSNPYDPAQVPRVTITRLDGSGTIGIEWQPAGAQLVRVYRGSAAGDGYTDQLMWSVAATSQNSLRSGIAYGVSPTGGTTDVSAKSLVPGEVYTAQVTRQDPKGSGDGFTNTKNRYVGTATFTR
jgi:hypothetical protein